MHLLLVDQPVLICAISKIPLNEIGRGLLAQQAQMTSWMRRMMKEGRKEGLSYPQDLNETLRPQRNMHALYLNKRNLGIYLRYKTRYLFM